MEERKSTFVKKPGPKRNTADPSDFTPVPGHRQYGVSRDGRVMRFFGGKYPNRVLAQSNRDGYRATQIFTKDKVLESGEVTDVWVHMPITIHRVVAMTFYGAPTPDRPWVNHKNGIKHDNRVENLEWSSISENIQHAHDTGLVKKRTGTDHWNYGKAHTEGQRRKMSEAKIGANHPKFAGWYVVNGKKYESAQLAADALGTYPKKIWRQCKNREDGSYFLCKKKLDTGSCNCRYCKGEKIV